MINEELKLEVKTLSELYNMLRHFFIIGPNKQFLVKINNNLGNINLVSIEENKVFKGLYNLKKHINNNFSNIDALENDLKIEFTRLFIGPGKTPLSLYASVYVSKEEKPLLMAENTIDVRREYLKEQVMMKKLYSIPEDHLGAEMEYMYYLCEKTVSLIDENNAEKIGEILLRQKDFLDNYLSTWIPKFSHDLLENTEDNFLKSIALILDGVIGEHRYSLK